MGICGPSVAGISKRYLLVFGVDMKGKLIFQLAVSYIATITYRPIFTKWDDRYKRRRYCSPKTINMDTYRVMMAVRGSMTITQVICRCRCLTGMVRFPHRVLVLQLTNLLHLLLKMRCLSLHRHLKRSLKWGGRRERTEERTQVPTHPSANRVPAKKQARASPAAEDATPQIASASEKERKNGRTYPGPNTPIRQSRSRKKTSTGSLIQLSILARLRDRWRLLFTANW